MNFKTTIVLLLLLIIAGWYFFQFEKDKPGIDPTETTGAEQTLFEEDAIDSDKLEKITIQRGDNTVVIEKKDNDWHQTAPVDFALNSWSVSRIPDDAKSLTYTESFTPGKGDHPTLDLIDLEPPQVTLTLSGPDSSHTIKLGKKLTIGGSGYVMLDDDDKVYIADDALHSSLLKQKVREWRKKSLTAVDEGEAKRVTLQRSEDAIEVVKTDGTWALAGGHSGRVATKAVSDLLSAQGGIYISEFEADQPQDLALYGLDNPRTTLRIEAGEDNVTELKIGAAKGFKEEHYFATLDDGNIIFSISKADKEKFDKPADDLRDKRITIVPSNDVNTVKSEAPGRDAIAMERSDAGWNFTSKDPGYPADGGLIADRLDALVKVEADAFIANYKPAGDPAVTLTLTATGRADADVLKIYAHEKDDQRIVMRNTETTGYVVKAEKLEDVTGPALSWRDRTVVEIPDSDLNRVTLKRPDGLTLKFTRKQSESASTQPASSQPADTGTWQLEGHDEFESVTFDALRVHFEPLLAERWTTSGKPGSKSYTVTLNDQTITIDPESRLGAASNVTGVFEVSEALIESLGEEFRHRTLLSFDADDIKSVKIGDVTVTKNDDDKYVDAEGNELDQSAAGGVFDTLAGLRVERYLAAPKGDATTTLAVTLKDDAKHTLALHADNTGKVGDKAFELDKSDVDKLTKKLTK